MPPTPVPNWLRLACWAALLLGVGSLVHGFVDCDEGLWAYGTYLDWALPFLGWWAALGAVGRRFFPRRVRGVGLGVLVLLSLSALGPAPTLTVALVALASWVVGDALLARVVPDRGRDAVLQGLVGLAGFVALFGGLYLLSRVDLHRVSTYLALLIGSCLLRWRRSAAGLAALGRVATGGGPQGEDVGEALPTFVGRWALLGILGLLLLNSFRPEIGHDAMASHLTVPHMVRVQGHFPYPYGDLLWSLMPMGGDWAFALVLLPGGEDAVHLLLFAGIALVTWLTVQESARHVPPAWAALLGALLASTSICYCLTGSAYVDALVGALQFGTLLAVLDYARRGEAGVLWLAALLLGGAILCKLTSVLLAPLVLGLVLVLDLRAGRLRSRLRTYLGVVLVTALVGAFPYVHAFVLTGNPTYPFYGELFGEVVLPSRVNLERYVAPIDWRLLHDLTFHSERYLEATAGAFGFHGLVLVPLVPVTLLGARRTEGWVALVAAVGSFLLVFAFQTYLRYVFGSLPMLLVASAVGLGWLRVALPGLTRGLLVVLVAVLVQQVRQLPAAAPWIQPLPLEQVLRGRREALLVGRYHRELVEHLNRVHGRDCRVLFTTHPYIAGLEGQPVLLNWYTPRLLDGVRHATDAESAWEILDREGLTHVIVEGPLDAEPAFWRDWVARHGELELQVGEDRLYRVGVDAPEGER